MKWQSSLIVVALILISLNAGLWLWNHPSAATRHAIEINYSRWHAALAEQRFSDAYAIMSPEYRSRHSIEEFSHNFIGSGESTTQLQPNYALRGFGPNAWLYPMQVRGDFVELWSGPDYEWAKVDGTWYMTGEYRYYLD